MVFARLQTIGLRAGRVVATSSYIAISVSLDADEFSWQTQGNLLSVLLFGVFVALAVRQRGDRPTHRRLMLTGTIFMLSVVASRLGGTLGPLGFFGFYAYAWVALITFDRRATGKVHLATWVCFALTFTHVVWVTAHVVAQA